MVEKKNELLEQLIEEHKVEKYKPDVQGAIVKNNLFQIERFIMEVGMTMGSKKPKERTPNLLVYWKYLKWCFAEGEKPIYRQGFFVLVRRYFPGHFYRQGHNRAKKQHQPAVRMTQCMPEPFIVSKEEHQAALQHLRDEREAAKWARSQRERKKETK